MLKLTIGNSECKLEGLSISQHKELKELLSYTLNPQASYFSGGYGPKKQSLLTNSGSFPTGLLYITKEYLHLLKVTYALDDTRTRPTPTPSLFDLSLSFEPYPEQIAAAQAVKDYSRGIIVAPTGVGKSVICSLIINKLQVRTLVVVPSLELKRQLTEGLKEAFGSDKVGKGKPIFVQNVDSIDIKDSSHGYDCVIIDEFHHSGAKTYRKLNKHAWSKVYYKVGLTATPFRSQDNERILLESVLSKVIYKIDYKDAVRSGYIAPIEAYYVDLPKQRVTGTNWASVYSQLVVNNETRNNIIAQLLRALNQEGISSLCLVKEIKHGEILKDLTDGWFANGENEDTPHYITLFNITKLKVLIGTSGVLGEGIDTKPCEYVIIAGLGKSKNAFMQQVGRSFRKFSGKDTGKIILFKDTSHKWTKDHFKAQCKYLLEEYNVVPTELKLD